MSDTDNVSASVSAGELRQFIERIERLEDEKADIQNGIKDVYAELRARGFDSKAVRTLVKLRKKERHELEEEQAVLGLYMEALGM